MKTYYCDDEHGNPVYIYREDPTRKFPLWEEPKLKFDSLEIALLLSVAASFAFVLLSVLIK